MNHSQEIHSYRKCLVVRSGGIGDIYHIYPILIDLKNSKYQVDIFLFHNASPALFSSLIKKQYYNKLITLSEGKFKALKKIYPEKYDEILILNASNEGYFSLGKKVLFFAIAASLSRIKSLPIQKVYFKSSRRKINNTNRTSSYEPDILLKYYNRIFKRKAKRVYDIIKTKPENFQLPIDYNVFILGTNNPINKLPVSYWVQIFLKLKTELPIVLIGGEKEVEYAREIQKALPSSQIINFTNKLNIDNAVYIISEGKKIYSHDTGLMHIAAAMNKDLSVFFSSRDQKGRWHPDNLESKVYYTAKECGYCMKVKCPIESQCLTDSVKVFLKN